MFATLNEQMKLDDHNAVSATERTVRWALIVALSIFIFGALYVGIHLGS